MGSGNIYNYSLDSIFVSNSEQKFSYTDDYHLRPSCIGINAGHDGRDIGLYGSSAPYKEGAVPKNPHLRTVQVSEETTNGNLPIVITVAGQPR